MSEQIVCPDIITDSLRMRIALERIATERFPLPTPCRETYLRKIAREALDAIRGKR